MSCQETQTLLHGHVDGELDLLRSLEMDQHLQECAACAQAYTDLHALRMTIKDRAPYFEVPAALRKRIQSSIRQQRKTAFPPLVLPLRSLATAASLGFILLTAWGMVHIVNDRSTNRVSTQELVVASHVRSEMLPSHLVDVESSNQHTVKPWFAGKIDFAPPVPDLKEEGFDLVGGRLDYLDQKAVATLVYRRRQHIINLFIWPATSGAEEVPKSQARQGYHLIHWRQSGMTYWAISDLNEAELEEFVRQIQQKTR
jgi:anti-sigma factor RsiW